MNSVDDLRLTISWFENAGEKGKPALGDPEILTWSHFVSIFEWRREGEKDGPNFVPSRFKLEADGRRIQRLKTNLIARCAIALDIETSKRTGEVPPSLNEAMDRAGKHGLGCLGYHSHSHRGPSDTHYRLVTPLSEEIAATIPAPLFLAEQLGLTGVLDQSKIGASSCFYLPTHAYDAPDDLHETIVIPGKPITARGIIERELVRQAEEDRIAAVAHAEAAARLQAKIAAGYDPDDSLIEKLRCHFDLDSILRSHGYDKAGTKYRHPNSTSGSFGADIKTLGGIERVYSHNAGDPLHHSNLPSWCTVTAVDAFDVVVILEFGADRDRALRELARRFNVSKAPARKAVAAAIYSKIRQRADQEAIEGAAYTAGHLNGLSRGEVCAVARWVASRFAVGEAA